LSAYHFRPARLVYAAFRLAHEIVHPLGSFSNIKISESDESIGGICTRKFTPGAFGPHGGTIRIRIYAGDPEFLSLRAAFPQIYEADKLSGSVIRGSLRLGEKQAKNSAKP